MLAAAFLLILPCSAVSFATTSSSSPTKSSLWPPRLEGESEFEYQFFGTEILKATGSVGTATTYTWNQIVKVTLFGLGVAGYGYWLRIGRPLQHEGYSYVLVFPNPPFRLISVTGSEQQTKTSVQTMGTCRYVLTDILSSRSPASGQNENFNFTDVNGVNGRPELNVVAADVDDETETFTSACDSKSTSSKTNSVFDMTFAPMAYSVLLKGTAPVLHVAPFRSSVKCAAPAGETLVKCNLTQEVKFLSTPEG